MKVRIAVCLTGDGKWNSAGWSSASDDEMIGLAQEPLDPKFGERLYWLEVELAIPRVPLIVPSVTDAKED